MDDDHSDPHRDTVGERWREGVARQARAVYESAHGNPVSDEARGVRWSLTPRVALTACVVILVLGAVALWVSRAPVGTLLTGLGPESAAPSASAGITQASLDPDAGSQEGWASEGDSTIVIVDVAGYVAAPGVRELPAGSRVGDAIDAAGGLLPDASRDTPNLARVLVDGEQVYVAGAEDEGASASQPGKINVNRADAQELEELPGVGPVLAQRILEYREGHGPFTSVGDLEEVSGIGPSLLAQLAEAATV
ncbi:helix-hairpin-helix domain-containing protein [Demequina aurantiaca]|uniref:helix-hairpin-helix domain-containing protein n=1 Tax=Demequina aurantiaca TaxID=676200 RepID=UPI003D33FE87